MQDNYSNQVKAIQAYFASISVTVRVVYYPGCGDDDAPTHMFPDARVIYLDIDPKVVSNMVERGYEAYESDVENFTLPELADVIFARNSPLPSRPLDCLNTPGFVVCNNWWEVATRLHNDSDFEEVARVDSDGMGGGATVDTSDLQLAWETVENDEQLKQTKSYSFLKLLLSRAGITQYKSVFEAYRALIAVRTRGNAHLPSLPTKRGVVDSLFIFRRRT